MTRRPSRTHVPPALACAATRRWLQRECVRRGWLAGCLRRGRNRFSVTGPCRPPLALNRREPRVRTAVMDVVRPGEGDENVDVQEPDQVSSRASATTSGVIGGASSRTSKTGKPSTRAKPRFSGRRADRTSVETTRTDARAALPRNALHGPMNIGIKIECGSHVETWSHHNTMPSTRHAARGDGLHATAPVR